MIIIQYSADNSSWHDFLQFGDSYFRISYDDGATWWVLQWATPGVSPNHNSLGGLQGGTTGQYYHLTEAEYDATTTPAGPSSDGYLTSTDWNIFNDKQNADNYITALTGDVTAAGSGSAASVVTRINGTSLAGLATGILKNTTATGIPSIAVAGDFPTLNQNTTGSAATLTTPRAIYGNNFNGSAALDQIIASTYGGTGNGFTKFTGPATAEKTFTLPNASATILTTNAAVTVAQGGTGITTYAEGDLLFGNAGGTLTKLADPGLPGYYLASVAGLPDWVSLASQAVTSLAGTANEITASASVGSVTLSLPAALTFTGKTVTGGTFNGGAFNGTVGATTPSTGAFTNTTVSGYYRFDGNPSNPGDSTASFYNQAGVGPTFSGLQLSIRAGATPAQVALFTSTGLNACAIGATTPSTGAFTDARVSLSGALFVSSDSNHGIRYNGSIDGPSVFGFDGVAFATMNGGYSERGRVTSTGFQGAIGATTPSTGAFTTLKATSLPTSSAGLSAGDVWNDSGTLKIV